MGDRVTEIGDRARERKTERRLDTMDRENDRLKQEVRMLRDDLQEERGSLQRALDALRRDEHVTVQTNAPKRRGRILRLIAVGGGAYLLGARAGRERYDQIVDKAKRLKSATPTRGDAEPTWEAAAPTTSTGSGAGALDG